MPPAGFVVSVYLVGAGLLVVAVRRWRRDLEWIDGFLYLLLTTAFFAPPLLGNAIQIPTDIAYEVRPWCETLPRRLVGTSRLGLDALGEQLPFHTLVRQRLLAGEVPLWSHELGTGQPLLGNVQSAPFAPLHLLALPLPPLAGLSVSAAWEVLLHLLLVHCLARALGAGRLGAALAAVSIGLSSYAVAWEYDVLGMAAAFIPGVLLGVVLLARGERGAATGLVACALGLALSGHPETVAHTALAALGVAGVLAFRLARRDLLVFFGKLAAATVLTACLAAPALFPFVQTLPRSQRWAAMAGKPDPERPPRFAARYLMPVIDPMVFGGPFGPHHEGPLDFTEMCSDYAGVLTLALAVAGAIVWRGRILALLAGGLGALLAALRVWPFFDLLSALPILREAAHARLRGFFVLAVGLAAGLALERFAGSPAGRRWALAAMGLSAAALLAFGPSRGAWESACWGVAAAGLGAALATLSLPRRRPAFAAVALVAVTADLFLLGAPYYPALPRQLDLVPPPALAFMIRQARTSPVPFRVVAEKRDLLPSLAVLYGLWDPRGNDPMRPANAQRLLAARLQPNLGAGQMIRALPAAFDGRFYDFLAVRFLLASHRRVLPPPWRLAFDGVGGRVWENPEALPLFFMPRRFGRFGTPAAAWQASARLEDFQDLGVDGSSSGITPQEGQVRKIRPRSNGFDLQVVSGGGTVVSSVSYDPGWRVEIDGHPARAIEVDSGFLGFTTPPGAHSVRLDYRPTDWTWGLALCGLGFAAASALGLHRLHQRLGQPHELRHGRHPVVIQEEEQVVTRRREIAVCRSFDAQRMEPGDNAERQTHQPLVHVEGMGHGAGADEDDGLDGFRIRRAHAE